LTQIGRELRRQNQELVLRLQQQQQEIEQLRKELSESKEREQDAIAKLEAMQPATASHEDENILSGLDSPTRLVQSVHGSAQAFGNVAELSDEVQYRADEESVLYESPEKKPVRRELIPFSPERTPQPNPPPPPPHAPDLLIAERKAADITRGTYIYTFI